MSGVLYTVGVGPGDPELMTLKAARILAAAPAYAYFAKRGRPGHAVGIARAHLRAEAEALRFDYPYTVELPPDDPRYRDAMAAFYDEAARALSARLQAGTDVALLCEGDPFFYGSAMHLFDRLGHCRHEVVSGVLGMTGCWGRAFMPMTHGDDVMSILPGTLERPDLAARLRACDAAVIMKVGRNLGKIRAALADAGKLDAALYVERGTMQGERHLRLATLSDADIDAAPYFSIVLVPGRRHAR